LILPRACTNLAAADGAPVLLANWGSAVSPPEIVRIDLSTRNHQPLSQFNRERVAAIDWRPLREFWFTSKGGKKIHNLIALPPGFDESKKYPLLVLMHGGPAGMWRDEITYRWNYHLLAQPGYVVLLTNYTGSTGFGEKFAQQIKLDPFIGPSAEINQAADEAIRQFKFIDGTRRAAAGASYGGHLANWLQATTTRYRCLISHAGLINLESQWGPAIQSITARQTAESALGRRTNLARTESIRFAKNFRTPITDRGRKAISACRSIRPLRTGACCSECGFRQADCLSDENHWILKAENSRFFYRESACGWASTC
jgi:dipeptidyl aminopeptidase/acylaminoacyl peptidase